MKEIFYLKITEQVLEGYTIWYDSDLFITVNSTDQ